MKNIILILFTFVLLGRHYINIDHIVVLESLRGGTATYIHTSAGNSTYIRLDKPIEEVLKIIESKNKEK